MRDDFAVFILSHGRPNKIYTIESLQKGNYKGKYYVVIDNEDDTEKEYRKLYGDKVLQFDKKAVSETFDTGDLSDERRTIVYARNVCFELAKQVRIKYFLELDDDYTSFEFRYIEDDKLKIQKVNDLNELFEIMLMFLDESNALTVALAQGGDFIGGVDGGSFKKGILRKAMNTFFCDVDKSFNFVGRINEDVNTYTSLGHKGELIMTVTNAAIVQKQTQSNSGGMTEVYLDSGTFLKSFYSVMYCPSAVKISVMGDKHKRIHHVINWNNCVPKILNEAWKK